MQKVQVLHPSLAQAIFPHRRQLPRGVWMEPMQAQAGREGGEGVERGKGGGGGGENCCCWLMLLLLLLLLLLGFDTNEAEEGSERPDRGGGGTT